MENQKSPKKSLGQNFLRDKKILKKIVDFAQLKKEDVVLEIGGGEGTLTELILQRVDKMVCIEKDKRMVEILNEKFKEEIGGNKLKVVEVDVLNSDISDFVAGAKGQKYKLLGNIPYYITGALFKKVLGSENSPTSITFVVQKEVAERIVARDGKESILSISIKAYGDPEYGGVIKAGSFYPKPKVDSAIIAIRNITKNRFSEANVDENTFFEVLKFGFAHKRKFLIKNLSDIKGLFTTEKLMNVFKKIGIEERVRAEDLKVEDWFKISEAISTQNRGF